MKRMEVQCARCGRAMACDPGPDCWCARLPDVVIDAGADACLCEACLREQTQLQPDTAGQTR